MLRNFHLINRRDAVLVVGLLTAVLVIFTESIQRLLDVAREVEQTYGLALIPALVILTVAFVFHQQSKRQEARMAAAAAAAEARQARARARELELLVDFGRSVARALDLQTLRVAVWSHLSDLTGRRDAWILVRSGDHWNNLLGAAQGAEVHADDRLERRAEALLSRLADAPSVARGCDLDGHVCFALAAGDRVVGALGVDAGATPLHEDVRRMLSAAAPLIAIAVRNVQLFDELREYGLRDGLTGCFNKQHALELIDGELRRARRGRQPVSVIMFDVDNFKAVNDRYGHLCGDAVLAAVGRRLREMLRATDLKCRYGGEEFLVVLPETPLSDAAQVADWIRRELADLDVTWTDTRIPVTASFGVAAALPGDQDIGALIARADEALYRAKREGRNIVRLEQEDRRRSGAGGSAPMEPPHALSTSSV